MGSEGPDFKTVAIHDPEFRGGKRSVVLGHPGGGLWRPREREDEDRRGLRAPLREAVEVRGEGYGGAA